MRKCYRRNQNLSATLNGLNGQLKSDAQIWFIQHNFPSNDFTDVLEIHFWLTPHDGVWVLALAMIESLLEV